MFEMLSDIDDVDKLTSYLHWSQLCYQYAEHVDRESLSWCIDVIINAKNALFGNLKFLSLILEQIIAILLLLLYF